MNSSQWLFKFTQEHPRNPEVLSIDMVEQDMNHNNRPNRSLYPTPYTLLPIPYTIIIVFR